ncbi:MAG: hypothetical protein V4657_03030 [Pseudomonadota bacterium]
MRLSVGITGHRETNLAYRDNTDGIEAALERVFAALDAGAADDAKPRLHALLALGADLLAVETALGRGWQVGAPLPFGRSLNVAINAQPQTADDAEALLQGSTANDPNVAANAARILDVASRVTCFQLAERDGCITSLFLQSLQSPKSPDAAHAFSVAASDRAALAGQVMIEQIDLLIAVWDGHSPGPVGGTRHTINRTLEMGISVVWIDANRPADWRLLDAPEALATRWQQPVLESTEAIRKLSAHLVPYEQSNTGSVLLDQQVPPAKSRKRFHAYRRIEAMFGGGLSGVFRSLTQHYAQEDQVVENDSAALLDSARTLLATDPILIAKTETEIVRRFARADAMATYLSDAYRGGMVANLLLAAFAVIGGVAYLPFFDATFKWPFALFEFVLLATILLIILVGRKRDWHGRWFQTRRVAEYLRHAPFMLFLGVARPTGSWPHSSDTSWPENYVRSILREIGLPKAILDQATLRIALENWIGVHVSVQRAYHNNKAVRLNRINHRLERISEYLFLLAMLIVAVYLGAEVAAATGLVPVEQIRHASKMFTFLGVTLPTLGGALAGIHYFADFGRFAAISESTASRLEAVENRIATLLAAPDDELDYGIVANIARAVDEIVVSEIEHWQDVFGGKHISVPV